MLGLHGRRWEFHHISMSSRFEKRERKNDSCREVQLGKCNAMDRRVGMNPSKWRPRLGIKQSISNAWILRVRTFTKAVKRCKSLGLNAWGKNQ